MAAPDLTQQHHLDRARRARELLQNPLVVEAFDTIEKSLHEQWATTEPTNSSRREDAYYTLRGLKAFRGALVSVMKTGSIVTADLRREQYRQELMEGTREREPR